MDEDCLSWQRQPRKSIVELTEIENALLCFASGKSQ